MWSFGDGKAANFMHSFPTTSKLVRLSLRVFVKIVVAASATEKNAFLKRIEETGLYQRKKMGLLETEKKNRKLNKKCASNEEKRGNRSCCYCLTSLVSQKIVLEMKKPTMMYFWERKVKKSRDSCHGTIRLGNIWPFPLIISYSVVSIIFINVSRQLCAWEILQDFLF